MQRLLAKIFNTKGQLKMVSLMDKEWWETNNLTQFIKDISNKDNLVASAQLLYPMETRKKGIGLRVD